MHVRRLFYEIEICKKMGRDQKGFKSTLTFITLSLSRESTENF